VSDPSKEDRSGSMSWADRHGAICGPLKWLIESTVWTTSRSAGGGMVKLPISAESKIQRSVGLLTQAGATSSFPCSQNVVRQSIAARSSVIPWDSCRVSAKTSRKNHWHGTNFILFEVSSMGILDPRRSRRDRWPICHLIRQGSLIRLVIHGESSACRVIGDVGSDRRHFRCS
jgi:hypothetical protein